MGFGACALGGALGSSDDLFVFTEPEWAALCGAGGAGVGYFANRDPATLHLIYEKPARQAPVKR